MIKLPSLVEYGSKLMYNVKIKLDDELTNYTLKKLSPIFDKHNMVTRSGMSSFFHTIKTRASENVDFGSIPSLTF